MFNRIKKWLLEDIGERKFMMNFKNKYFFPIRFWIFWNICSLKKEDIDSKFTRIITFEDDFDKGELDKNKWNTAFPWGRHSFDGGAWSTDGENLKFDNSTVKFETKYEPKTYEGWWGKTEQNFTTAHIDSKNKFQQQFGRFELKVKLTDKIGLWPAFWLLHEEYKHPDAPQFNTNGNIDFSEWKEVITPEIDIFEQFGKPNKRNQMQFTLHGGYSYSKPWLKSFHSKIKGVNLKNKWIKISIEITKDFLKWYVNDTLVHVIYQKHLKQDQRVFRPVYVIVSTGTSKNPNFLLDKYKKDKNYLPDGMEVDWVRVYKPLYYEKDGDIQTDF
jgi:beta-glucanase (GH16 family)